MSVQPNLNDQALSNGLPPQFGKTMPFNGLDSAQSSRTSSPSNRLHQIPVSQLPPSRYTIPPSQLPPQLANINQLTQNYAHLSVSQSTPATSPKVPFSTSTPLLNPVKSDTFSGQAPTGNENRHSEFSPIISAENGEGTTLKRFQHSVESRFTSVPLNVNNNTQSNEQFQNVPLDVKAVSNIQGNTAQIKQAGVINTPQQHVLFANPLTNNELNKQNDNTNNVLENVTRVPAQGYHEIGQKHRPQIQPLIPPTNQQFSSKQQYVLKPVSQNLNNPGKDLKSNVAPFNQLPTMGSLNLHNTEGDFKSSTLQPQSSAPIVSTMQQKTGSGVATQFSQQPFLPHQSQVLSQKNAMSVQPNVPQSFVQPTNTNATPPYKANLHANRYPTAPQSQNFKPNVYQQPEQQQNPYEYQNRTPLKAQQTNYQQSYNPVNVVQSGFNKGWGQENYDLLQCPNILPPIKIEPPKVSLGQEFLDAANCSSDIFRCTMTKIPETNSLLQKSRLPLGILIHPFKDLDHLPVIQCSTIVRCRACRTYVNPFVFFVDSKRWKCNLCYRINDLPEEFQFDPVSKTYGDPSRRPEIKASTIEYIAPSEYMLRPPQPAVYLFLLDVSHAAIESEYLHTFCNVLTSCLSNLPGDARTQVGFIAYNSALHFYSLAEGLNQPHEMTVLDIEDVFLPCPDNLIVNLQERKSLIIDLLTLLPTRFSNSYDVGSALGAALQAAHKMIACTGGRITVFQSSLPTVGPGALSVREDPSQRAGAEIQHLNPANDFYKRLALECSGQQIAVDLFIVNSQYVDLATISGISRFSGGCIHHFPLFKASRTIQAVSLERTLKRYLTRKIGFEAVMRIRCTRGLSIHTFHGNFFVRSTDLLSLPNVNPEAGFGMQVSIDESLSDLHTVCFQAALLYTSSKGERRIRVHTLCVPIATTLPDVLASADQQCIIGILSKMAVDRSMQSSLADAREAFINVAIDILSSYKLSLNSESAALLAPQSLKLLPLYISALLKFVSFRTGTSTRLDDRIKAMCDMKSLPLYLLIQKIYPDLYPVHNLEDQTTILNIDGEPVPQPPHLQLSARSLESKGAFLMDTGEKMMLFVGSSVSHSFLNDALGVPDYNSISEEVCELPNLDTPHNHRLNNFINSLNDEKPFVATLQIIRENSPNRHLFVERLIEDRIETALSYHEFLQHLKTQVK